MKGISIMLICFWLGSIAFGQNINIRIFSKYTFSEFTFTVDKGKYQLVSNNKVAKRLKKNDSIKLYIKGKKIRVTLFDGKKIGNFKHLQITGVGAENYFSATPKLERHLKRQYDDDLKIFNDTGSIKLINDVNFEKYIGAVVECEGGPSSHIEYYKSQAILCRTYAMRHYQKHMNEGYSLCDDVHCQAYKHRCYYNREIYNAALETAGLVIVDDELKLISATFYSNSGGQTANSEDVWSSALPYLRSQSDPYSVGMRNFRWKKEIALNDWIEYLKKNGAEIKNDKDSFTFKQPQRKKDFRYNTTSIPTKIIRKDWKLKSAFFDISLKGDTIVIDGRGYGHGVGLAQEGAMAMANKGHNYEAIIKQYYMGVNIMSIKALDFFQIEQ
jgi:stage II sporulation protein D